MSGYENVVSGKLRLKGKALDVKAAGMEKQKKYKKHRDQVSQVINNELLAGQTVEEPTDPSVEETDDANKPGDEGKAAAYDDHLTTAERRYIEQREKLDVCKLAREANKSHRDMIADFNQYLANLSEHYDIPEDGLAKSSHPQL